MKHRHFVWGAAVALCASASASAPAFADPQSITWSAQNPGGALGDPEGNELTPGAQVRLGYFLISPAEVAASFDDPAYLDSRFEEVGRESVGNFGGELYEREVETAPSRFDVPGAFAQTITLEPDTIPGDARFYIWATDGRNSQALFSAAAWRLRSGELTALQWGIESVDPDSPEDVYLADSGPETSATVGGVLNKLRALDPGNEAPGDLEDPDGNGIVHLLEEAFLAQPPATAHYRMPYMAAADVLVYHRKSGGSTTGWDRYRAADLEYRVEASSDFRTWQPASELLGEAAVSAESLEGGGERVALRFTGNPAVHQRAYFRVHVQRVSN